MKQLIIFSLLTIFSFNPVACAQASLPSMSAEELIVKMKSDSTLIILDIRTDAEISGPLGKIDGIIHIPVQELERRVNELDTYKDKEIAVICRSGNRSKAGTAILLKHGFNAKNVLGGMIEYRKLEAK
jgi:rhodanese-related sulfurtransferase